MSWQKQNPFNVKPGDVVELDPSLLARSNMTNPVTVIEFVYDVSGTSYPTLVCVDGQDNGDEVKASITRVVRRSN
jgi:hypothetical protein